MVHGTPVRKSLKMLLLNSEKELLLMCCEDPRITNMEGKNSGRFWIPVGGGIEEEETLQETAYREIYEETGIPKKEITLGPVVWFGDFYLKLSGVTTHVQQQFMVAHTSTKTLTLSHLTPEEKNVVKEIKWVALAEILTFPETIYPMLLREHIAPIIEGNYPSEPMKLDLD